MRHAHNATTDFTLRLTTGTQTAYSALPEMLDPQRSYRFSGIMVMTLRRPRHMTFSAARFTLGAGGHDTGISGQEDEDSPVSAAMLCG